eukprot:Rmarinus@m.22725
MAMAIMVLAMMSMAMATKILMVSTMTVTLIMIMTTTVTRRAMVVVSLGRMVLFEVAKAASWVLVKGMTQAAMRIMVLLNGVRLGCTTIPLRTSHWQCCSRMCRI